MVVTGDLVDDRASHASARPSKESIEQCSRGARSRLVVNSILLHILFLLASTSSRLVRQFDAAKGDEASLSLLRERDDFSKRSTPKDSVVVFFFYLLPIFMGRSIACCHPPAIVIVSATNSSLLRSTTGSPNGSFRVLSLSRGPSTILLLPLRSFSQGTS